MVNYQSYLITEYVFATFPIAGSHEWFCLFARRCYCGSVCVLFRSFRSFFVIVRSVAKQYSSLLLRP